MGDNSVPAEVALVLRDETKRTRAIDPIVQLAKGAARLVYIVQTKIDLIPRDRSRNHMILLRFQAWCRYHYEVECIPISALTGEGMDVLLSEIGAFFSVLSGLVHYMDIDTIHQPTPLILLFILRSPCRSR